MKLAQICRIAILLLIIPCISRSDIRIETEVGGQPLSWTLFAKLRTGETFLGKNISLLNDLNREDRLFYMRHTLDASLNVLYGSTACEKSLLEMMLTIRNKGVWGSVTSIAQTTDTEFKILDSVGQSHRHYIPRHMLWIREAWLQMNVGETLGLYSVQNLLFTFGAFPFQLGRGIALGDAYAVSPDYLGFYADSAVDQYAFGAKLFGEVVKDKLTYDIYFAFLNNQATSLSQTGERVLAQVYGKRDNPIRGFPVISYIFATRLQWQAIKNDCVKGNIEPYALYYHDPEQKVEIMADAEGKLATFGLAGEFVGDRFEWGFDIAFNRGRQRIKGIDRNVIQQQNRNGHLTFVNSHVLVNVDPLDPGAAASNLNAYHAPQSTITIAGGAVQTYGSTVQKIINASQQDESQNGMLIGQVAGYAAAVGAPNPVAPALADQLFNAKDRFRNPYVNKLDGFMWVTDGALYFAQRQMKLAVTAGMATGDADPNFEEVDGTYHGFIPLQSVYSGKRVKSAFIMGSAGKLKRPLAEPEEQDPNTNNDFAVLTSDFTNLVFIGGGLTYAPHDVCRKWTLNPNLLAYWRQHADQKFDIATKKFLTEKASKFLGIEANLFYLLEITKDFKFFTVASMFVPGQYYTDIRGKPMNAAQERALDRLDPTGFTGERVPGIGTDNAYTLNFGVDVRF
ncbi:hypothetical protein KJZ61_03435 [Candidatus Dependentiae bacterium]|nr:hypothetical protein [Candidatus Dependentiae bacterium]